MSKILSFVFECYISYLTFNLFSFFHLDIDADNVYYKYLSFIIIFITYTPAYSYSGRTFRTFLWTQSTFLRWLDVSLSLFLFMNSSKFLLYYGGYKVSWQRSTVSFNKYFYIMKARSALSKSNIKIELLTGHELKIKNNSLSNDKTSIFSNLWQIIKLSCWHVTN